MTATAPDRLARMLLYVETDPGNLDLLATAAEAALDAQAPRKAIELIERYRVMADVPPPLQNIAGLAALQEGQYEVARSIFEHLLPESSAGASVRANLAWATAMLGDWRRTLDLLDELGEEHAPESAALRVQALHHLGDLETAVSWGRSMLERRPQDMTLAAALSYAALDAEDFELAKASALAAGPLPQGETALGMVMLSEGDPVQAMAHFERALVRQPEDGRTLLGKGLGLLAADNPNGARTWLDRAATTFGDHAGSWVAAGWTHFLAGDLGASRSRFEKALVIDENFAEVHGALAVLDITSGNLEGANRRAETAFRLDRECFAAALAKVLLLAQAGDEAGAARVRGLALRTRAGPGGSTIAEAMAKIGPRRGGR